MSYEVKGTLKVINDTQTFESGFQKREFVVTTEGEYPQDIKLEFTKEKTQLLNTAKVGDSVNVHFNLRGNFYELKNSYYVNLQAWKVDYDNGSAQIASEARQKVMNGDMANQFNEQQDESSLPF